MIDVGENTDIADVLRGSGEEVRQAGRWDGRHDGEWAIVL